MSGVEQAIQKALIRWMTTLSCSRFACAANFNEFARHHKDMGMDVGSADLVLRKKRGDITHFLYLELKKKDGKLLPSQIKWNKDFDLHYASDNCTRDVAYGFDHAKEIILAWLSD